MTDARIVLTSVDDPEKAKQLALKMVELGLAACVNIIDGVHSIYRWQGKIETEREILLLIKTQVDRIPALKEKLIEIHPYRVPELLVLPVIDGTDLYLEWLIAATRTRILPV